MGGPSEVFKPEFPYIIERGVPFSADGLFVDLFLNDPLYVLVDEDKAKAMLGEFDKAKGDREKTWALKEANVVAYKAEQEAKMETWRNTREAPRLNQVVSATPEPRKEQGPRIMPKRQGGEG
jgi:hypothetical protein